MDSSELKNILIDNSFEIFHYIQKRKSFFFFLILVTLLILFGFKNEYAFKMEISFFCLFLNSLIPIFLNQFSYKKVHVNFISMLLDFSIVLYASYSIEFSKYFFMLWLFPICAQVFVSSSKRWSSNIAIPSLIIVSFVLSLTAFDSLTIDQFEKNYIVFEQIFLVNTLCLSLFIFSLFYGVSKNKENLTSPISKLVESFNSAISFPKNNPFPIFEYREDLGLIGLSKSAKNLIENISDDKKLELEKFVLSLDKVKSHDISTFKIDEKVYQLGYARYEKQINIYMIDISEVEKAKAIALEKSQYAMAIIDAMPGFVSWVDADLNYLGVNQKMLDFFDVNESDFIGKKVGSVFEEKSGKPSEIYLHTKNLFKSRKKMIQQELMFEFGDRKIYNIVSINKYNDDQNAVLVSVDITEVKEMEKKVKEEQLRAESSAKLAAFGEMAAGIAHEINNPLSVISGMVGIIKKQCSYNIVDTNKLLDIVNKVDLSIDRINKIIKGMKNLSRDGTNDPFEFALIAEIMDDTFALFNKKCLSKNIDLRILDYPLNLGLDCQLVQIGQVLVILLNNAIDAIEGLEERWIKIEVSDFYNNIKISISDSGKGISKEISEKVFSPFFTTKPVGKGTGLGLSLAYRIVHFHSGTIAIDELQENTKFDIILPKRQKSFAA